MDEDINFCPHCGKKTHGSSEYCLACGTRLNVPETDKRETFMVDSKNDGRLNIGIVVMVFFSAISLLSGIYIYLSAAEFARDILDLLGTLPGITEEEIIPFIELGGLLAIASGAIGSASAALAWTRRFWLVTVIMSLAAAFTGSVFCLIAAYLFYKAKPVFKD